MPALDELIKEQEKVNLSGTELRNLSGNNITIHLYQDLEHIHTLEQLFAGKIAVALLYQTKDNYGHWVGLLRQGKTIEFFDPYGWGIDEQLKYSEYNLRRHQNVITPHLTGILKNSMANITVNKYRLQKFAKDVNTCGRWVAMRVRFHSLSLTQFATMFTGNQHYEPDFWVSALSFMESNHPLL